MKNILRRQDRKLSDTETLEILKNCEFGVLSMSSPNNEGYGVPLNYVMIDNAIYFHCANEGEKIDVLRTNNKVSFCVVGKTEVIPQQFAIAYESVIVSGSASEVHGEEKYLALTRLVEKYSHNYIQEGNEYIKKFYEKVIVVKLSIESITGKSRKH